MITLNKLNLKYLLNAFLPLLYILSCVLLFTYFIYNEKNKIDISAEGEINLIGKYLQFTPKIINHAGVEKFTVLHVTPNTKTSLDADLDDYVEYVQKILVLEPKLLVIRLMTAIDNKDQKGLYKLKNIILASRRANTKVVITYPQGIDKTTPEIFKDAKILLLDDDICSSFYCSYNPKWSDWSVQWAVEHFSAPEFEWHTILTHHINKNYPVFFSAVAAPDEFLQLTTKELMEEPDYSIKSDIHNKYVFLGNELTRPVFHPLFSKGARGYRSIYNMNNPKKYGAMTAPHLFWAQLAHMALAKNYIKIAHKSVSWIYVIACLLLLFFCLRKFSMTGFLGIGILTIALWFVITTVLFVFHRTYLFSFTVYYILCLSVLIGVFVKFTNSLMQNWRLEILNHKSEKTNHLKQNFISLISHNLNTPIAKLTSITELVRSSDKNTPGLPVVESQLFEMEKMIKLVLTKNQLEENSHHLTTYIFNDIVTNLMSYYNRINTLFDYKISIKSSSEFNLPVKCDLQIMQLCLLSYIEAHCDCYADVMIDISSTEKNIISIKLTSKKPRENLPHNYSHNVGRQLLDITQKNKFLRVQQNDTMHELTMDWTV